MQRLGSRFFVNRFDQNGHGKARGGDIGHHLFARFEPIKATVFFGHKVQTIHFGFACRSPRSNLTRAGHGDFIGRAVGTHRAARVHQAVAGQIATLGDLVIVEIMRAGDFHSARSKGGVGVFVGDDRDQAVAERQLHHFAHDGRIARV